VAAGNEGERAAALPEREMLAATDLAEPSSPEGDQVALMVEPTLADHAASARPATAAMPAAPRLLGVEHGSVPEAVAMPRTVEPPPVPASATSQVTVVLDQGMAGASRIRVALRGDVVHATIMADVAAAATLTQRLPELQRALRDRGFSDAQLSVRVLGAESVGTIPGARLESPAPTSSNAESRHESDGRFGQRRSDPDGRHRQSPRHPEPEEPA
jgi:hypothetical protein